MSKLHLDYSEYKALIGDYGVTPWTKYNWLSGPESPFFGGFGKVDLGTLTYTKRPDATGRGRQMYMTLIPDMIPEASADEYIPAYCEGYNRATRHTTLVNLDMSYATEGSEPYRYIVFVNNAYTTVEAFKAAMKGKFLVYEKSTTYTRLLYIQSSGTQYIDTGLIPKSTRKVYAEVQSVDGVTTMGVNGWGSSGAQESALFGYSTNSDGLMTSWSGTYEINTIECPIDSEIHKFILKNGEQVIDGVVVGNDYITDTASSAQTMYLFAEHGEWTATPLYNSSRIYRCKIYENDVLIRDFIPARRNSDGVVGMYDAVNDILFTNQGTGSFIAGEIQ